MSTQARQGVFSPFLREQRIKAAKPYLDGRVLDVGCGDGAIAPLCEKTAYYGYDLDSSAVSFAKTLHPGYTFSNERPDTDEKFNTVVLLAVIEHLKDPGGALKQWARHLSPEGRLILTTPIPALEWAHRLGASVGLFSGDAAEEHETLIDHRHMRDLAMGADLMISKYERFLCGANQLFILSRAAH